MDIKIETAVAAMNATQRNDVARRLSAGHAVLGPVLVAGNFRGRGVVWTAWVVEGPTDERYFVLSKPGSGRGGSCTTRGGTTKSVDRDGLIIGSRSGGGAGAAFAYAFAKIGKAPPVVVLDDVKGLDRGQLIAWLEWNDPDGDYSDVATSQQGMPALSLEDARRLVRDQMCEKS